MRRFIQSSEKICLVRTVLVKSFVEFQDEDQRENLLLIANTKPSDLLKGEKPILFDEWQDAPKIWGESEKTAMNTLRQQVNTI